MILLSYIGVHQIFQLALAAEEIGLLDSLHCSLVDRPGKWGARLCHKLRIPSARAPGSETLPTDKLIEHPIPLLANRLGSHLPWRRRHDHLFSNTWFDHLSARAVSRSNAKIFIGVESCALASMQSAKKKGMVCVLDCPGVPVSFLDEQARLAALDMNAPHPPPSNSAAMLRRKKAELRLADHVLCCSDLQAEELRARGVPDTKIHVVPLWVDSAYWSAERRTDTSPPPLESRRPLRVILAGSISLKKGAPYLIEAMRSLGNDAECLLVGRTSDELRVCLAKLPPNCRIEPYMPKERLRKMYSAHDVLVMPTLGDSFGFVGMEAMAAGLPVIASSNAGLPLPSPDWRVPPRNAEAIAARLRFYRDTPEALSTDSNVAQRFAAQFSLERYRKHVQEIFRQILH